MEDSYGMPSSVYEGLGPPDYYSLENFNDLYPWNMSYPCLGCTLFNMTADPVGELGVLVVPNPEDFKYPWISNQHFYPNILTFVVTLLIGVFGNIIVIVVMAGDRKSRTTTNIFLVSLSVADLLMLSVCVPLEMIRLFVVLLNFGGAACRMGHYFMMLSFTASVLNLTAVSLERFIVIVFPMKSRSLCTLSNCRRSVLLVWVISLILACPIISVVEEESIIYTNPSRTERIVAHYCKDVDSLVFPTYRLIVLFCIPAVLMIIFYAVVICELWKSAKNIRALTNSSRCLTDQSSGNHGGHETYYLSVHSGGTNRITSSLSNGRIPLNSEVSSTASTPLHVKFKGQGRPHVSSPATKRHKDKGEDVRKTRKQIIKMLIVVVLLFILCWGPTIITEMLIGLGKQTFTQEFYVLKLVSSLLPFIHCCINPLIYCFMSKNFRRSMSRVITNLFRPCTSKCCHREELPLTRNFSRAATTRMSSSFLHENPTGNTDYENISAL